MRDISKAFGDVAVLRGVTLEVAPGEILGLVGQNGAGKSTLMRVLAGAYPDYSGEIELDGQQVHLKNPRSALEHGVAVIYQEFSLIRGRTVAENIVLGAEPGRLSYRPREVRRMAARLLEEAGMAGDLPLDTQVAGLSTSVQQRVEIAKALSRDAKVLVLDEPTSRLTEPDRERLFQLMRRIADSGVALVFISHFLEEVLTITDRLTVMRDGAVVSSGRSNDFDLLSLSTALMGRELARDELGTKRTRNTGGGKVALSATGVTCGPRTRDVSLSLRSGEIVGVAGLVGSGRSTLAKALAGALPIEDGELEVHDRAVHFKSPRDALRAGIALIPEDRRAQGLIGALPAAENMVIMGLARRRTRFGIVANARLRKDAREAMARFEIRPADARRRAETFSGGNQQKLLLARAILAGTEVVIIDQPTAGVDVGTKAQIHRILREVADEGKAILVISDEVDELLAISDRLLVMRDGLVVTERDRSQIEREELLVLMSGVSSK
jgi:ribose transport system ATP-binding protein